MTGGQEKKMITGEETKAVIEKFGRKAGDTGCPEVQIALLTKRIESLAPHFESHKKDYHSMRGLLQMIGQRKRLLRYLASKDEARYKQVIKDLGLRK